MGDIDEADLLFRMTVMGIHGCQREANRVGKSGGIDQDIAPLTLT